MTASRWVHAGGSIVGLVMGGLAGILAGFVGGWLAARGLEGDLHPHPAMVFGILLGGTGAIAGAVVGATADIVAALKGGGCLGGSGPDTGLSPPNSETVSIPGAPVSTSASDPQQRGELLEREVRSLRITRAIFLVIILALACGAWYLAGHWSEFTLGEVRARVFKVVDGSGVTRATLGSERFVILDDQGRERIILATTTEGTVAVGIKGENGQPRVALGLTGETGSVIINDANGKTRCGLIAAEEEATGLTVFDSESRARASLTLVKGSIPSMFLFDADQTRSIEAFMTGESSEVNFRDKKGKDRLQLYLKEDSSGFLLRDENGMPSVSLGRKKGGGLFQLIDERGQPFFTKP